jgi:hypothetical protein
MDRQDTDMTNFPVVEQRHYFCSCSAACTAEEYIEHVFEKGHDRALEQRKGETPNVKPCPNDNTPMQSAISQYVRCPVCGYQEGIKS